MVGCLITGDKLIALTVFILTSLLEAGESTDVNIYCMQLSV